MVNIRDIALFLTLAIAVFTDLRSQKIYNVLTFPMTALGIVASLQYGSHWWDGLAGAGVAVGMGLVVEMMRAMRMGDVKLLMAVGALTTPAFAVRAVLLSVAVNLVYGVAILAAMGRLRRLWRFYKGEGEEVTVVAYAPAIAAAVLWVRFMPWP
jgi:prepilin peptidase CpaA